MLRIAPSIAQRASGRAWPSGRFIEERNTHWAIWRWVAGGLVALPQKEMMDAAMI